MVFYVPKYSTKKSLIFDEFLLSQNGKYLLFSLDSKRLTLSGGFSLIGNNCLQRKHSFEFQCETEVM